MDQVSLIHFVGILIEMAGISLGAYTFREVIFKKIFTIPIMSSKPDNTLPTDPKTGKKVSLNIINKRVSGTSVALILIGLFIQLVIALLQGITG